MKKSFFTLLFIAAGISAFAWGIYGHKHITHAAIFALPKEMAVFYYNHADYLTEEAVVPDVRKYTIADKAEFARHFINLEAYGYTTVDAMPQTMEEATAKYASDTLQKHGILPWYIQIMMGKLTNAFKNRNIGEILVISADLSHYVADAHMPLHTSINHNGQFTDQKGIHGFWESQLPEMFGTTYNYHVEEAHYIPDITKHTWAIIAHTYSLADSMLQADRDLKKGFALKDMYELDSAGHVKTTKYGDPIHSKAYATQYHEMLHGMVERQMRLAIQAVADYWYTAWVNAGKPNLDPITDERTTKRNKEYYQEDMKAWEQGHIYGLEMNKEYK